MLGASLGHSKDELYKTVKNDLLKALPVCTSSGIRTCQASGSVLCELRKHGTTTGNAIYPVILQSAEAFTKLACSLTFEKEIQGSKQRKKKVYWFLLCLRQKALHAVTQSDLSRPARRCVCSTKGKLSLGIHLGSTPAAVRH